MIEPTRDQIKAALAASYALRDHGTGGVKPVSCTADLEAHARVMLRAALNAPEPPTDPAGVANLARYRAGLPPELAA